MQTDNTKKLLTERHSPPRLTLTHSTGGATAYGNPSLSVCFIPKITVSSSFTPAVTPSAAAAVAEGILRINSFITGGKASSHHLYGLDVDFLHHGSDICLFHNSLRELYFTTFFPFTIYTPFTIFSTRRPIRSYIIADLSFLISEFSMPVAPSMRRLIEAASVVLGK